MRNFVSIKFSTNGYRRLLVALILAALAAPLFVASAYAQQDPYFDPSLGVGDSIIRSDVFVGDKQGRATATEGLFTRQLSGWLSGGAEVLMGVVVPVSLNSPQNRGCLASDYLTFPAGKIALIRRGTCSFQDKITNAYNAGAIGAIVYNRPFPLFPGDVAGDNLIRMGDANGNPNPGLVPIPGFFVGYTNGSTLAATPVSVKIQAASFVALKNGVEALQASGILSNPQAGSLKDVISAASDAANKGNFAKAVNLIEQFQADILALKNANVLSQADWMGLNDAADIIVTRLTSPFTGFSI